MHYIWIALALVNFSIQLGYFFNDRSLFLFRAKKVTTPLLLFLALWISTHYGQSFAWIPCLILLAMGLGEIGIEGSNVVEAVDKNTAPAEKKPASIIITLAGILFLLVNIFIGSVLLYRVADPQIILNASLLSVFLIGTMLVLLMKLAKPEPDLRLPIYLYAIGLVILLAGGLADALLSLQTTANLLNISGLGLAGLILASSDSLVLIRMGARWQKTNRTQKSVLLAFLIAILLLYYFYMAVLVHIIHPFSLT